MRHKLKTKQIVQIGGKRINVGKEFAEQNRLRKSYERKLRRQVQGYFKQIYNDVADLYEQDLPFTPVLTLDTRLQSILQSHYRQVINAFGERQLRNLQKQDTQFEQIYEDYVRSVGAERVVGIKRATRSIIQRVINANKDEGVAVIAREIRQKGQPFDSLNRYRSATIARTETHNAASFANDRVARSLNIPDMQKRWTATNDPRTRATHVQASGQTVPMDEDFTVGGRAMGYAGDPRGGASNVINCRCVIVYVSPEDVVTDDTTITPKPRQARDTQEVSLEKLLSSPRDASFTHETFKIGKKAVIIKSLDDRAKLSKREYEEFFENPDFINVYGDRFGRDFKSDKLFVNTWSRTQSINRKKKKIELSDEALSIVEQSMKEVDELAKRFKIPRINSITIGVSNRAVASMGDGILFLNAGYFNRFAKNTSKVRPNNLNQSELRDLNAKEVDVKLKEQRYYRHMDKMPSSFPRVIDGRSFVPLEYAKWQEKGKVLLNEMENARDSIRILKEKGGFRKFEISTYKLGQKNNKPGNVDKYYDNGLDQARSTIYHEFGHHVHQTIGLNKAKNVIGSRSTRRYVNEKDSTAIPIEKELKSQFGTPKKRNYDTLPSAYANFNEKEYFAENFANYFMGKKDLVTPEFKKLIERIMREQNGI